MKATAPVPSSLSMVPKIEAASFMSLRLVAGRVLIAFTMLILYSSAVKNRNRRLHTVHYLASKTPAIALLSLMIG